MVNPGIEFDHIWKKFRRGEFHDSLRDLIPAVARRLVGRRPVRDQIQPFEFWAVRDVSFTVGQGEALGIIGANGAGKSTILKIVTGILRANQGRCVLRGRVGALIEVAAGFHGDLTGRENIFLQGAIMGMSNAMTRRRFDQIVEFSGIEEFLDTPVKRYSSGMNARLGFAIAAHLDPDVLVVDEVLAVGDVAYQARAFDRIRQLVGSGIPVLVVSHQLDRIAELCTSAILLDRGSVVCQGPPGECIRRYVEPLVQDESPGDDAAIHDLRLPDGNRVRSGERLRFSIMAGRVPAMATELVEPLAIMLRNTRTNAIVAAVGATTCGVTFEDGNPAPIEGSLQLNVPAGLYALQTFVWDRKTARALAGGPSTVVIVEEGPTFTGNVQLNAEMHRANAALEPESRSSAGRV
jgi:ABC-type polysaccharide/polyol phosphate transport system ATPase subunit